MMGIDASAYVAPTARVHPKAVIGPQTRIGEYCVIEEDVAIGARCVLEPYVFVKRWTTLGEENEISAGTALGTDPLDKSFNGERSYLVVGHRNKIREHYTISRGTAPESVTRIGDDNFIMTSGHIAHDCLIGNNVVIASCSLISGYVEIEDSAFISGGIVVHQYSRIGRLVMIAGLGRVNLDLVPYVLYKGYDTAPHGLNLVGLRRAGFSHEAVRVLKRAYTLLFRSGLKLEEALRRIEQEALSEHTRHWIEFARRSRRGICRRPTDSGD